MNTGDMRKQDDALVGRLETERQSWDSHWGDLAAHFMPRSSRFGTDEKNRGSKKNTKLINGAPARSARTLAAGMFSRITSPARPWFAYTIEDQDLAKYQPVKEWLDDSTRRIRSILAGSNYYKSAPAMFRDLGVFGTHAQLIDEDDDDVVRCYPFPIGSYCLSNSSRLAVDLSVRTFAMTARQLVQRFGKENVPAEVLSAMRDNPEQWFDDVVHVCGPNPEHDPQKLDSQFKRYSSRYYLKRDSHRYLSLKGYDEFPVVAPRWQTNGEDVYGESPAMLALPDARSLMIYERRLAQGLEKKVNPPLKAPLDMKQEGIDPQPGKTVFSGSTDKIGSLYDGNTFQLGEADAKAQRLENAIASTLYVDLFLMMTNSDRRQITAEEIRARQEEQILAIGEPLERLNDEALGPALDRIYAIADRRGMIAPPPPELVEYQRRMGNAKAVKVNYVSALHQVQRMVKLGQIDRAVQFLGSTAGAFPDVLDGFDFDQAWDEYAEGVGLPPKIVRSQEERQKRRGARAKAQAEQQQLANVGATVQGAKVMSETDTGGQNALTDLMRSVGA
jgi:hypothetical protein